MHSLLEAQWLIQCLVYAETQYPEEAEAAVKGMESRTIPPQSKSQLHHFLIGKLRQVTFNLYASVPAL